MNDSYNLSFELKQALQETPFDEEAIKNILSEYYEINDDHIVSVVINFLYVAHSQGLAMGLDIAHDAFEEAKQEILHEAYFEPVIKAWAGAKEE